MREIPLKARDKRPRDLEWTAREYTAEEVAEWRDGGGNVGLCLEPGDLVIDLDPKRDPANDENQDVGPWPRSAEDMLRDLDALFGMDLAGTAPINRTGNHGLHVLLTMPPETVIRKRPFRENKGFEFKQRGSQIVAPGSTHPVTGLLYSEVRAGIPLPAPPALLAAIERPVSGLSGSGESIEITRLARILDMVDATEFRDHDEWLEFSMGLHAATDGSDEAKDLWVGWCWSDDQFDGDEEILERWESFSHDGEIQAGTFFKKCQDILGAVPPVPVSDDLFDAVEDDDPMMEGVRLVNPEWRFTGGDPPKVRAALLHNILEGLRVMPHRLAFNELSQRPEIDGGELQDPHIAGIIREISDTWGTLWSGDPPTEKVFQALTTKCLENSYHPIRDYLRSTEWDGKSRLDTWLSDFTEAEATVYIQAVGRLLLLAAVGRVMEPGVKYDVMVVLEGYQGSGKSTLVRTLGGEWTAEGMPTLSQRDDKVMIEAFAGKWFVEFDELVATKKSDVDHVKAFLSRTEDRARMSYGRFSKSFPRQIVMVGTTNDREYLRDMTGNRRFLPVRVDTCDFQGVAKIRDQLFAEALHIWDDERPTLNLPPELFGEAAAAAEARRMTDPLEEYLRDRLEYENLDEVHTRTLLDMLEKTPMRANEYETKRIANVMRQIGWDGPKNVRVEGRQGKGFRKIS